MRKPILGLILALWAGCIWGQVPEMYLTQGHSDDIECMALSPDGRLMATGGEDNKVFVWDVASGRIRFEIGVHTDQIAAVFFSANSKLLLTSSDDDRTFVWSMADGAKVRTLNVPQAVNCIDYSPGRRYIVSGHSDRTLRVWDANSFTPLRSITVPNDGIPLYSYGPVSGRRMFFYETGSNRYGTILEFDTQTLEISGLTEPGAEHEPKAVSEDGNYFFRSIYGGDSMFIYSTDDLRLVEAISKEDWPISAEYYAGKNTIGGCLLRREGRDMAGRLAEFDFRKKEIVKIFDDYDSKYKDPVLSPDRKLILFKDDHYNQEEVSIYERESGMRLRTTLNLATEVNFALAHPTKPWFACDTRAAEFRLLDFSSGEFVDFPEKWSKRISDASFSPDGKYMLALYGSTSYLCFDLDSMTVRYEIEGRFQTRSCQFSPDGKRFVLSEDLGDNTVTRVFDTETGQELGRTPELKETLPLGFFLDQDRILVMDDIDACVYSLKTRRLTRHVNKEQRLAMRGQVGSKLLPMDRYRGSIDRVNNKLLLMGYNSLLVVNPASLVIEKKIELPGGNISYITSIAASPDGKYLGVGKNDGDINFLNLATGKTTEIKRGHAMGVNHSVGWTKDGDFFYSFAEDGGIKFWDPEKGKLAAGYVLIDPDNFLLYTSENHYFATKGALPFIGFKKDNRIYPYEQFDLQFNRPDKVLDKFGYLKPLKKKMFFLAYQKRLKRQGISEAQLSADFHVPEIEIPGREDIPLLVNGDAFSFSVKGKDSKYPLQTLRVWVNEVPVYSSEGKKITSGQTFASEIKLNLSRGRNEVKVSVLNSRGTESTREGFTINSIQPEEKPVLYLVAVGVSKFKDNERNLGYAVKDAIDFAEQMTHTKAFSDQQFALFLNEQASLPGIRNLRNTLEKTSVDDHVVFFISSHGLLDENLDYYLALHETDFEHPASGSLPYTEIEALMDGIPARNRLILIDACHSGEVDKDETELGAVVKNDQVSVTFKSGPQAPKPKAGLKNSFEYMQALFSDVSAGLGATVISAAGGYEYALESGGWSNGVFTYALLKAMQSRDADENHDRAIQLSELRDFVVDLVYRLTDGKQVPTVRKSNPAVNFRVY